MMVWVGSKQRFLLVASKQFGVTKATLSSVAFLMEKNRYNVMKGAVPPHPKW